MQNADAARLSFACRFCSVVSCCPSCSLSRTLSHPFLAHASLAFLTHASLASLGFASFARPQHPLDLLMRMSPLAFIQCVIYGLLTGELSRVQRYGALEMTRGKATALLLNGVIAFGLNIVSFTANKKAGVSSRGFFHCVAGANVAGCLKPLTMTVAANCKQVLTIAIAVVMFNLTINITNGIGILLTLIGGVSSFLSSPRMVAADAW